MSDTDAAWIAQQLDAWHMLHGFVHETKFTDTSRTALQFTTGNGDGALWTGMYLAAEAYRYAVTGDAAVRTHIDTLLGRVRDLAFAAPSGFLVRTIFPKDTSPTPSSDWTNFYNEELHSGLFDITYGGQPCVWVAHPTRDQYAGVFFGLGVTYDLIADTSVRDLCKDIITHLIRGLIDHAWVMGSPGKPFQETYLPRPDHTLSVLQLGKHVNPSEFGTTYDATRAWTSWLAGIPMLYDIGRLRSNYDQIHLNYLYYFNLIRLETDASARTRYVKQYTRLRNKTEGHFNPHFNMIDYVINGPNASRDTDTKTFLGQLLTRGFLDKLVNLTYPKCGGDACDPVPVAERPYADFLWQRSPFGLSYSSATPLTKESAGIDYILPWWMARYYGVPL